LFPIITLPSILPQKKIFFASDFHLGRAETNTRLHERKIIDFLDTISNDAQAIFLLGDIFDFWFEYKYFIPKGFVRFQNKLASLSEQKKIDIYFCRGNHDSWIKDYFEQELGIKTLNTNTTLIIGQTKILIGHGDDFILNKKYSFLKKYIYQGRLVNWLAEKLPPDFLFNFATKLNVKKLNKSFLSSKQRLLKDELFHFCKNQIEPLRQHDYYVLGHLHLPYEQKINNKSHYYNTGDWLTHFSYVMFDGIKMTLMYYKSDISTPKMYFNEFKG